VGDESNANFSATRARIFEAGAVTDLGSLGGAYSTGAAINRFGLAAGSSTFASDGSRSWHAVMYADGGVKDLGTLGGQESAALGLNDWRQVVGRSQLSNSADTHAFSYKDGVMRDLGTLGGTYSAATDVNNDGAVVGSSLLAGDATEHAFLYADGGMTDLGALKGQDYSYAAGINNLGQVVGASASDSHSLQGRQAFLYANGVMTALEMMPGTDGSDAYGINDLGQVVGFAFGKSLYTGFLFSDGVMMDLNALIDPASGFRIESATAINNAGQIIAYGLDKDGLRTALRLDPMSPVPEPVTAGMLLSGLGLLVLRRRFP
jgi:probable HAF family extracellular repeat protein